MKTTPRIWLQRYLEHQLMVLFITLYIKSSYIVNYSDLIFWTSDTIQGI